MRNITLALVSLTLLMLSFVIIQFGNPIPSDIVVANVMSTQNTLQTSTLNHKGLFYSDSDNKLRFTKIVDSSSPPVQVLSDPLYESFTGWQWSDISHQFIVSGPEGIYTYSPNDAGPILVESASKLGYQGLINPAWLNDGKGIVFIAQNKLPNIDSRLNALILVKSNQTPKTILGPVAFDSFVIKGTPQWFPDGTYIAFLSKIEGGGSTKQNFIALLDLKCTLNDNVSCVRELTLSTLSDNSYTPDNSTDPEYIDYLVLSPDGRHVAFACETGLCLIDWNNTDFRHFQRLNTSCKGNSAWSPDSQHLTCASDKALELVDIIKNTEQPIENLITQYRYNQNLVWIPIDEIPALNRAPTPNPSFTPALSLQLTALCQASSKAWFWEIINPNSQPVAYSLNIYDPDTTNIEEIRVGTVISSKSNIPGTQTQATNRYSSSSVAQLYVNKQLQATSAPNETHCPTTTPKPTQ